MSPIFTAHKVIPSLDLKHPAAPFCTSQAAFWGPPRREERAAAGIIVHGSYGAAFREPVGHRGHLVDRQDGGVPHDHHAVLQRRQEPPLLLRTLTS